MLRAVAAQPFDSPSETSYNQMEELASSQIWHRV